jgi:hypothetical protein
MRWVREMFECIRREIGLPSSRWEYGTSDVGGECRRHRLTGRIEFILWPIGHPRGYSDRPFWCEMGAGHTFIPEPRDG